MTSRLGQKTTSILAVLVIVLLLAFLIFLWTGVQHGLFKTRQGHQTTVVGVDDNESMLLQVNERRVTFDEHVAGDEGRPKVYLPPEKIGIGKAVEYVKPIKISPLPLHEHDIIYDQRRHGDKEVKPLIRHHSGNFRHHSATLWDPYPQYTIDAFGKSFHLDLVHNSEFVSPDLKTSHIWADDTVEHTKPGIQTDGCFYSGRVKGDEHSSVAVSLCNGMTGYIRTTEDTYYIEPVEHSDTTIIQTRPILHAIHRVQKTSSHSEPHKPCATFTNDNLDEIYENDLPQTDDNTLSHYTNHNRSKRETANLEWKMGRITSIPSSPHQYNNYDPYEQSRYEIKSRYTNLDRNRIVANDYVSKSANKLQYVHNDDMISVESASFEDLNYGPIGTENRRKREDGQEYFIEIMIMADKSMTDMHKSRDNVIHYILTLMSYVALLFKDPSIGNPITISVTGIHTMETYFEGKESTNSSRQRLINFCESQITRNVSNRYDTAMLLTRLDLCPEECNTLGIANIGTMCNKNESCSLVKDKGLSTSFTIAHELGHVLNMPHDQQCNQRLFNNVNNVNNIMTNLMDNETVPWLWSNCSRHYVTEFLDSSRSKCLTNKPNQDMLAVESEIDHRFPGESFTRQHQCELIFGKGWTECNLQLCGLLSCLNPKDGSCHTPFVPWADGTNCGNRKWCHHGHCIPFDTQILTPVMGGWNEYKSWSECSLTCGGGIQKSVRECNNPRPQYGGKYCTGKSVRYRSCNTQPCPVTYTAEGHPQIHDVREEQCAKWNGIHPDKPGVHNFIKWIPKYGVPPGQECKLTCRIEHSSSSYPLDQKVIDGTKCQLDGFDVCVNGICRPAGCDNILGSNITLDKCGVCDGDGSSCTTIRGSMMDSKKYGYNKVIRIPKGSRAIEIVQHGWNGSKDENCLALVDSESNQYLLNGNFHLMRQKILVYGGITIEYSGITSVNERLNSSVHRSLQKDLIVQVFMINPEQSPNITYQYTVPKTSRDLYVWTITPNWTPCNDTCEGHHSKQVICININTRHEVPPGHCSHIPEPDKHAKNCNMYCQLRWEVTSREECSTHCGNGIRRVHYDCVLIMIESGKKQTVDQSKCANIPEASPIETCVGPCNQTAWLYGPWSSCSVTCGRGQKTRNATCVLDKSSLAVDPNHCAGQEKYVIKPCELKKCPEWSINKWTPCSVTCGKGVQKCLYSCHVNGHLVPNEMCDETKKPDLERLCEEKPCPTWHISEWTKCSKTCGKGYVEREVYCRNWDGTMISNEKCNETTQPEMTRYCTLAACPEKTTPKVIINDPSQEKNHLGNDIKDYSTISPSHEKDYTWRSKAWNECSKKCGMGQKRRVVFCIDENGVIVDEKNCNNKIKPVSIVDCNKDPCPEWQSASWSKCDSNCYKNRQVRCQNHQGENLPDTECSHMSRPTHAERCSLKECTLNPDENYFEPPPSPKRPVRRYQWFMSNWSSCSKSCGQGTRERIAYCVDSIHKQRQEDHYCSRIKKRRTIKRCFKNPCPGITWLSGPWSNCSAQCDNGMQTRAVTCNRVRKNGIVDRINDTYCSRLTKPPTMQSCKIQNCDGTYYWHEGPWQSCSPACGKKRRQERHLYCYQREGKKVHKHHCSQVLKPARRRKCSIKPCSSFSNCREVKLLSGSRFDREYTMNVSGRNISIFCHGMATNNPREYLTLHAENFAEYYGKRLRNPNTCPNNGKRPDKQCNECFEGEIHNSGYTIFKRIRLNVSTLEVITDDFTYTNQLKGKQIPYGTAGDCYSSVPRCPQGQFEINLQNTGFQVSHLTEWNFFNKSSIDIRRKSTVRVIGRCGGECGYCAPNPIHGLILEVT